jgi:two-component system, NarL family, response regulator LiaR
MKMLPDTPSRLEAHRGPKQKLSAAVGDRRCRIESWTPEQTAKGRRVLTTYSSETIGVAIVADCVTHLDALSRIIREVPRIHIISGLADYLDVRKATSDPAIAAVIVSLPCESGHCRQTSLEYIAAVKARRPNIGIVLLQDQVDVPLARAALRSGATACCVTTTPRADLFDAIRAASLGATWLDRELAEILFQTATQSSRLASRLTQREHAVLQLITKGYSNMQMATVLNCASGTINTHVTNVFRKLGVNDRVSAAVYALRQGLVQEHAS